MGKPRYLSKAQGSDSEIKVSIIIPARNEELSLGTLLASINKQSFRPVELIVANDNSDDQTPQIAKQLGATVIDVPDLPNGWKGKPWACHNAAQQAKGDYLLFLDADTVLSPIALQNLADYANSHQGAISVCPFHSIEKPYEELSAFFNVLMVSGSNAFGTANDAAALFGQCMLIPTKAYLAIGGHETVKFETLENFRLASVLADHGIERHCLLGKGAISMRMFHEGLDQLKSSWKKGFTSGAANTAPRALLFSSIWISGAMFSIIALLVMPLSSSATMTLTLICFATYALQCMWLFSRVGNFSPLNAILYPISLLFYQATFFTALREKKAGKTTQWKGREVA